MKLIGIIAAVLTATACVSATTTDTMAPTAASAGNHDDDVIEVMIIGSYHMAGSSADVIHIDGGNVLSDRRQRELADITSALGAFAPTVVVTERVTEAPGYIDPKFLEYNDEMLATVPNERVQLAYRLAGQEGVKRVYGLDEQPSDGEPDYFPLGKLMAHLEATGQAEKMQALIDRAQSQIETFMADTEDDHLAVRLIGANNGFLDSPEFYYAMSDFDVGEDQPAAELQAYWFMRNAKIWSKLIDVTEPGDRVIVVYGAGHKFWLEHMAEMTPGFTKVDPVPYLESAIE